MTVLQPGYRIGDRVVRPARVAVADPASPQPARRARRRQPTEPTTEQ